MDDIWGNILSDAVDHETLLRASELEPNMIVRQIDGEKNWRVMGCYCPDGFSDQGLWIAHMQDEHEYDWTYLYSAQGKMDEQKWILLGWYVTPKI